MDWSALPPLISFPWELSEFEWPFWLVVLLTAWLVWRSFASRVRQPGILPSLSTMTSWPRVLFLLSLAVSVACVAAVVLQFPPNGLGLYRGYYWTDTRRETLLATVLLGFGPLVTFIALYAPLRWIIRHKARREWARNRTEAAIGHIVVQATPTLTISGETSASNLRRGMEGSVRVSLPAQGDNARRDDAKEAASAASPADWRQATRLVDEHQEHVDLGKAIASRGPDRIGSGVAGRTQPLRAVDRSDRRAGHTVSPGEVAKSSARTPASFLRRVPLLLLRSASRWLSPAARSLMRFRC
jgi:hypothetical protein